MNTDRDDYREDENPAGKPEEQQESQGPQEQPADVEPESVATSAPSVAEPEGLDLQAKPLTTGQIVAGLIVQIDEHGALVDVGTKSEGHIAPDQLGSRVDADGKELAVGDRVAVYVVRPEDEGGSPVLSKKIAEYERVWQDLSRAYEGGDVLTAMVTDRVKGGLVVDLGLRGFLPASHVEIRNVHALDRFVGQSLKVKIIEVDRARKRVVVSQKQALQEDRRKRRERTLASLEEGKVFRGVVRRITDYGAFVDLGGVDGLLHVTEMAWTRIDHPKEVLRTGEKIDVMVLRFDREQNRISLGRKQMLPDPWEGIRDRMKVGQTVKGTVSRLVPFGAFVRLENGIEGVIPNAELPGDRGQRARDVLSVGQEIEGKITNLRPQERRMTLSLRQVQLAQERQQLKDYMKQQQEGSRVTIGDLVGDVLAASQGERQPETTDQAEAETPVEVGEAAPEESAGDDQTGTPGVSEEQTEAAAAPEEVAGGDRTEEPGVSEEQPEAAAAPEEVEAKAAQEADIAAEPERQPAALEVVESAEDQTPEQALGESSEDGSCSSSESPAESEAEKD